MWWLVLFAKRYHAQATFATRLEYACVLCGTRATAGVESIGVGAGHDFGLGGSHQEARAGAEASARANAVTAVEHAPCPSCARYQPAVTERWAAFTRTMATKKRRSLPLAAIAAAVVLLAGIVPAVRDLRHSSALLVALLAGVATVFALVFAASAVPPPRPTTPLPGVMFWWRLPDGSEGWVPPPATPVPELPPRSRAYAVACGAAAITGLCVVVASTVWVETFVPVFVVDTRARPIAIDGEDVTGDARTSGLEDAHVRKLTVRKGADHVVETAGAKLALLRSHHHGWVIAPDAQAQDICFVEIETAYGPPTSIEPGWHVLEPRDGLLVLPRRYDDHFKASPAYVDRQSARRWAVRTTPCSASREPDDQP